MKVTSLQVQRERSYSKEDPGQLQGILTLTGASGQQTITLSPGAINRILGVIAAEVQQTARANAQLVGKSIDEAVQEGNLLTHDGELDQLCEGLGLSHK
jgi:hypothetical protein